MVRRFTEIKPGFTFRLHKKENKSESIYLIDGCEKQNLVFPYLQLQPN